jgi:hypothetical protein
MRAFEQTGGAVARGAMHTAACRHGRRGQGLASGDLCGCSPHHLISGRTGMVRTHIPHACGKEATRIETHLHNSLLVGPGVARSSPAGGRQEPLPPLRTKRSDYSASAYTSRLRTSYSSFTRWTRTSRAFLLRRSTARRPRMSKPRDIGICECPLCGKRGRSVSGAFDR